MPLQRRQLHRFEQPHHARFLTFSCYQSLPLLGHPKIRDTFTDRLSQVREAMDFRLYAYVIMPNHVHLLLSTHHPTLTVKRILSALKPHFAQKVIQRWRELGANDVLESITDTNSVTRFWQPGGGYDRNIVSDSELFEKIDYIHANPIRQGLVKIAEEWKWSSANWYSGKRVGPRIDPVE